MRVAILSVNVVDAFFPHPVQKVLEGLVKVIWTPNLKLYDLNTHLSIFVSA